MPSIRRIGSGRYEGQVRIKGFSQSKTFDTKSEALKWAYGKEGDLRMGFEGHIRGKTLQQAFDRYLDEVTPKKKGQKAETNRIKRLKQEGFAYILLDDVDSSHVQGFVDAGLARGLLGSSVNRDISLLSAVFSTCRKKWKWMTHNPIEGVDKPKEPPSRNRRITEQEISSILLGLNYTECGQVQTIKQYMSIAFLFALETAMRQGEILGLQWSLVDFDKKSALLPDTKNGKSREVPLSRSAIALLSRIKGNHKNRVFPINKSSASTVFLQTIKKLNIENLTFHDTRHEATTRLAKKIPDSMTLAKITGHTDPRSLMVYYNPTATELADMLD